MPLTHPILDEITPHTHISLDAALKIEEHELFSLLCAADDMRKRVCGDVVSFVNNRNLNFTNVCVGDCAFCAFSKTPPFELSLEQILVKVEEASERGATEMCIQGGLHPEMVADDYCEILETIKEHYPKMHLHAFSPMEVMHAVRDSDITIKEMLTELKRSGLGSMPGTAAEILVDEVRRVICPHKLSTSQWVDVITTAHELGIPTTATMMYGHVESWRDRVEHMLLIRSIQQKTHGFTEFVPLPFMPQNNPLGERITFSSGGVDDLKVHAIARILLFGLVDNIQASWVKLGHKLAQVALCCGANDLGGTLMEEAISSSAGGTAGQYTSPEHLKQLITEIGRVPRQRDTVY
ncbi:MAG: 5-amino-6-(D-ribitylamino)uracil--L-tyrosine 4-hydroxyphenyl transferase CofH, partial [Methermicoccaceae archaeon]